MYTVFGLDVSDPQFGNVHELNMNIISIIGIRILQGLDLSPVLRNYVFHLASKLVDSSHQSTVCFLRHLVHGWGRISFNQFL